MSGNNTREAEIVLILIQLHLPVDICRLIARLVRESFTAEFVKPIAESLAVVNMIKTILKPSDRWEGIVEVDVAVIDTGWDQSFGRKYLSTLFRYCSLIERIVNDYYSIWENPPVGLSRPSTPILLLVWKKRWRAILDTFGRG